MFLRGPWWLTSKTERERDNVRTALGQRRASRSRCKNELVIKVIEGQGFIYKASVSLGLLGEEG